MHLRNIKSNNACLALLDLGVNGESYRAGLEVAASKERSRGRKARSKGRQISRIGSTTTSAVALLAVSDQSMPMGLSSGLRGVVGAYNLFSIVSVAAKKSNREQTSTMTMMTGDAAVNTETNIEGFIVEARATGPVQRKQRRQSKGGGVQVVVDSVYGVREVRLSVNVDIDDDGRCGC